MAVQCACLFASILIAPISKSMTWIPMINELPLKREVHCYDYHHASKEICLLYRPAILGGGQLSEIGK